MQRSGAVQQMEQARRSHSSRAVEATFQASSLGAILQASDLSTVQEAGRAGVEVATEHVFFKLLSSTASQLKSVRTS